jgi:hypothetical protein
MNSPETQSRHSVQRMVRRLWHVLRPHKHSIYVRCLDCHTWGVNIPDDSECGNCRSRNTVEYYPCGSPNPNPTEPLTPRELAAVNKKRDEIAASQRVGPEGLMYPTLSLCCYYAKSESLHRWCLHKFCVCPCHSANHNYQPQNETTTLL